MTKSVLVTCAGAAAAINIIKGLKAQSEISLKVYAVDQNPLAAGLHLADEGCVSPSIQSPQYLNFLMDYCRENKIEVLFPGYSKDLEIIAQHQELLRQNNIQTLISSDRNIKICNDKMRSSALAKEHGLLVPKIVENPTLSDLPLIAKPNTGTGSKGLLYIKTEADLNYALSLGDPNLIFQEWIEGTEYTVDILCDQNSHVLFAGPRIRDEVKTGLAVKSTTVENAILQQLATQCCHIFKLKGVCNVQFIQREQDYFFLELNPRFGAASILTILSGANLPLAALKLMLGYSKDSLKLDHQVGRKMTRYWEEIIV